MTALNEGADPGGRSDTGFCALWHADHAKTRQASIAVRKWGFISLKFYTSLIFSIRCGILPGRWMPTALIKIVPASQPLGQRRKGSSAVTLGTIQLGPRHTITSRYLTAKLRFIPNPRGDGRLGRPSWGEAPRRTSK